MRAHPKALSSCGILLFLVLLSSLSGVAAGQQAAKLGGTWDVHIEHMSGRIVDEQWVIEQDGNQIRGTVKTARADYPLAGTVDGERIEIKVTVTSERFNIFRGTLEGSSIKGSISQKGDDGRFSATRAGSASQ